jgi:hypothetical protein
MKQKLLCASMQRLFFNGLSAKADTLIDIIASNNFISKEFVTANGFYKDRKTAS